MECEIKSPPKYIHAAIIQQVQSCDYVQRKHTTQTADCNHTAHNSPVYHLTYGLIFCDTADVLAAQLADYEVKQLAQVAEK